MGQLGRNLSYGRSKLQRSRTSAATEKLIKHIIREVAFRHARLTTRLTILSAAATPKSITMKTPSSNELRLVNSKNSIPCFKVTVKP